MGGVGIPARSAEWKCQSEGQRLSLAELPCWSSQPCVPRSGASIRLDGLRVLAGEQNRVNLVKKFGGGVRG
jgi:hypothetical protein